METRTERDSLGEMHVPVDAYYGAQTQRAVENFPISSQRFGREFIRALGMIKLAVAAGNRQTGRLDTKTAEAIETAAREVMDGAWDEQFVVDVYQTGSGTSTNMNTNEVIARRATELLTEQGATKSVVHPNDHVNKGQSSNDVIPSAIHVAGAAALSRNLLPALDELTDELGRKTAEFAGVAKIGRTHLQDATPIMLGQEFSGYAAQVRNSADRIRATLAGLCELALGGTAVGTGLNASAEVTELAVACIADQTGLPFRQASNHFEAQACKDAVVHASGALKTAAVSLIKIANDIRWLGSGPRCGIGELVLPATQPGSSIMPGKVNPVQAEALLMVCARVLGNDTTITFSGQAGNFELNVMMPVMAQALLESITLLANAVTVFTDKCVRGLTVDRDRAQWFVEQSLALVTALVPEIGYDRAAELAKQAHNTGKTIRELLTEQGEIDPVQLDNLLDPKRMTGGY